jgi:DeoR/GlpR family transcriptional regulator of sugar metabolism
MFIYKRNQYGRKVKSMNAVSRRKEILSRLESEGEVSVNELSNFFGVSQMTIRRDLIFLEKQGVLITNYGGAHLAEGNKTVPDFSSRSGKMTDFKKRIGEKAASFLHDGDTVFMDTGTTIHQLAKNFPDIHATVITNSWSVLQVLGGNTKIKVVMAPGTYRNDVYGVLDGDTIMFLDKFHVDKAFLSAIGCSERGSIATMEEIDAKVKRLMWENCKKSYLLIDHTKFYQQYLIQYNQLSDFDYVLTNSEIEKEIEEEIRKISKNLILC